MTFLDARIFSRADKLFFFTSYEGTADYRNANRVGSVPTAAVRSGDFSGFSNVICDPLTGNPDGSDRIAFTDNRIPESRIDPVVRKLIAKIPPPNVAGNTSERNKSYGNGRFTWDRWTLDNKVNRDFGLFRNFRISENFNLQFRMEAFNLTNTPYFGNPNGSVTSSDFMEITGASDERQFRFGLRFSF